MLWSSYLKTLEGNLVELVLPGKSLKGQIKVTDVTFFTLVDDQGNESDSIPCDAITSISIT